MSKLHYIIVLLVVLTIATLTYHLSTSVEQTARRDDPEARHDPDYFIRDFSATMYDKTGKTNYRLDAEYLEHFPDDDTLHVTKLNLSYKDTAEQSWLAKSDKGVGYENIDVIHLSGNVNVIRQHKVADKGVEMLTDKLRIDFIKRKADTDSKVKIIGKNSTIVATGMELDLDSGTLLLKSQARGQYAPN